MCTMCITSFYHDQSNQHHVTVPLYNALRCFPLHLLVGDSISHRIWHMGCNPLLELQSLLYSFLNLSVTLNNDMLSELVQQEINSETKQGLTDFHKWNEQTVAWTFPPSNLHYCQGLFIFNLLCYPSFSKSPCLAYAGICLPDLIAHLLTRD